MSTKHHKGEQMMSSGDMERNLLGRQVAAKLRMIEFLDAVAAVGTVGELFASEDGAEWSAYADDFDTDATDMELLDTEVLEIVGVWRGSDRATAELEAVELLMCFGGPTVRATVNFDGSVTVRGSWGSSDPVELWTTAEALAECLFELLDAGVR